MKRLAEQPLDGSVSKKPIILGITSVVEPAPPTHCNVDDVELMLASHGLPGDLISALLASWPVDLDVLHALIKFSHNRNQQENSLVEIIGQLKAEREGVFGFRPPTVFSKSSDAARLREELEVTLLERDKEEKLRQDLELRFNLEKEYTKRVENDVAKYSQQVDSLREEVDYLTKDRAEIQSRLRQEVDLLNKDRADMQARLRTDVGVSRQEISAAEEQICKLTVELAALTKENRSNLFSRKVSECRLIEQQKTCHCLELENGKLKELNETLQKTLEDIQKERDEFCEVVDSLDAQIDESHTRTFSLELKLGEEEMKADDRASEIKRLTSEITFRKAEMDSLRDYCRRCESSLDKVRDQHRDIEHQLLDVVFECENAKEDLKNSCAISDRKLESQTAELKSLRDKLKEENEKCINLQARTTKLERDNATERMRRESYFIRMKGWEDEYLDMKRLLEKAKSYHDSEYQLWQDDLKKRDSEISKLSADLEQAIDERDRIICQLVAQPYLTTQAGKERPEPSTRYPNFISCGLTKVFPEKKTVNNCNEISSTTTT